MKAKSIDQVNVFSQGSGSATFVGDICDVFVRMFSSGAVGILGNGEACLLNLNELWRAEYESI